MPTRLFVRSSMLLALALLLVSRLGYAQITATTAGIAPFGSYTDDPSGVINAATLDIETNIPVRNKGVFFSSLHHENVLYYFNSQTGTWYPNSLVPSQFYLLDNLSSGLGFLGAGPFCQAGGDIAYTFFLTDPTGFVHTWPNFGIDSNSCVYPSSGTNVDAYGYSISAYFQGEQIRATVTDPNGTVLTTPVSSLNPTDANGNQFSFTPSQQTLDYTGNAVLTRTSTGLSYNNQAGNPVNASITTTNYTIATDFQCPGIGEWGSLAPLPLPTKITMPDGSYYRITYEATPNNPNSRTGRIASITLPTGGTETYTYNGPNNGINCLDGSTSSFTRQTSDGTWTYTHSFNSSTNQWKTVITAPNGQSLTYLFTSSSEYEVSRTYAESNGTVTATIVTCYNGNTVMSSCASQSQLSNLPAPTEVTAFTQLPNASGQVSEVDTIYNSVSLPTSIKKYNFGGGAPGPLLETTTITYGSYNGSGCTVLGNNIVTKPCSVKVVDGPSGNTKSLTYYSYDLTTPVALSGTTQHQQVTGSRGNLEKVQRATSNSKFLVTKATHYDTGAIQTSFDVNGAMTTYNYSSPTTTCGNRYPDSVSLPLGQTESFTWDCNGGVLISAIDVNNNLASQTNSDPYWRLTSVTDQTNATTSFLYTATTMESTLPVTTGASVDILSTVDGLGRPEIKQIRQF